MCRSDSFNFFWDLIPQTGPAGDKAVSASFMVDIF